MNEKIKDKIKKRINIINKCKKELESISFYFAKKCHNEKCKSIYKCPRIHKKCKEGLWIETAIYWIIHNIIDNAIMEIHYYKELKNAKFKLSLLHTILGLHYNIYTNECDMLERAVGYINKIIKESKF